MLGIHSGVPITVWNALFSESAPPILPSAGGLLSLLSSEGLAVELPRSGARLFWWRRETQCQWSGGVGQWQCDATKSGRQSQEVTLDVVWGWSACECRDQFSSYNCFQRA